MILQADSLGKKFNREWILKNLNFKFEGPGVFAVTGPNGSGKSTLLKLIAGYILPTKGVVNWELNDKFIEIEEQFRHLAVAAPYLQLIEDLTLNEFLDFHLKFKSFRASESKSSFLEKTGLINQGDKFIKDFSSGMKQRVKLGLCFYFQNELLLIDEGTTNLDKQGVNWFQSEIQNQKDRLIVLFSNQEEEYKLAKELFNVGAPN